MIFASESELAARIVVAAMQCGGVVPSNVDAVCEYYDKVLAHVIKNIAPDTPQSHLFATDSINLLSTGHRQQAHYAWTG